MSPWFLVYFWVLTVSSYILECYLWELFWDLKVGPIRENLYLLCQYLKALPAWDHFKINSQLEVFWSSQVIWIQASYHYKFSGESIFPLFQVLCFIKDNFLYRPLKGDEIFLVPHNTDSVTLQHCRYYVCILLLNYWQTLNLASFTSTRYDTRKCWSSPPSFQNVLNVKDYFQWSISLSGCAPSFSPWTRSKKPQSAKLLHSQCAGMMRASEVKWLC